MSKISAYLNKTSFFNNETIEFKINSLCKNVNIFIFRFSSSSCVYKNSIKGNFIQKENKNIFKFIEGYNWITNFKIDCKNFLYSGLYFIELKDKSGSYYLCVNIKNKKNKKNNLVLLNSNTWNAYNNKGGSSFYRYELEQKTKYGPRINKSGNKIPNFNIGCTFRRPNDIISDDISIYINNNFKIIKDRYSHLLYGELKFLRYLELNNIKYDLIDDRDLDEKLIDISKYNNLILNCHPEYWSYNMLNNVKVNANNIISLAGNVSYCKILWNKKEDIIYGRVGYFKSILLKNVTGSYYDCKGYNTFHPYKILEKDNSLFKGIKNDYLGESSLYFKEGNSGHETDKKIKNLNIKILSKGTNPDNG